MELKTLSGYGSSLAVLGIALLQLLFAGGYLASCELRAKASGECEPQWIAAQARLFGAGGTTAGLFTRVPALPASRRRDDHGRFTRDGEP